MRNNLPMIRRAHVLAAMLLIAADHSLAKDCDLPPSWCDKLQSIDDVLSGKAFKDRIPDVAGMIGGDSAKNAANAGAHAYGIQREGMDVFGSGMNCLSAETIDKGTDDECMSQAQKQQSRFWDTSMPDRLKNMVLDVVPDSVQKAYEKVESIITDANWITGRLENAKKRITDAYESVTGVFDTADSVQADIDAALNAANASFNDQWDSAMDGRLNELENELERQLASSISNTDSNDVLLSSIMSLAAIAALQKNPQALSCAEDLINSRPSQTCISMAMQQTEMKPDKQKRNSSPCDPQKLACPDKCGSNIECWCRQPVQGRRGADGFLVGAELGFKNGAWCDR